MRKASISEAINLLIVLYFFQDALFKIVYWNIYGSWLRNVPYLHTAAGFWKYAITIFELLISFGMVFPRTRVAMIYVAIGGLLVAMVQILTGCIFSHHLSFPFHLLWLRHATWFVVLLVQAALSWAALAILWIRHVQKENELKLSLLKP